MVFLRAQAEPQEVPDGSGRIFRDFCLGLVVAVRPQEPPVVEALPDLKLGTRHDPIVDRSGLRYQWEPPAKRAEGVRARPENHLRTSSEGAVNLATTAHRTLTELGPKLGHVRPVHKCAPKVRVSGQGTCGSAGRRPRQDSSGSTGGTRRPDFCKGGFSAPLCGERTPGARLPTPWQLTVTCEWCDRAAIIVWGNLPHCRWHWELNRRYGRLEGQT